MIEIRFTVQGWQEADAFFGRLERALGDLSQPLGMVREEVRHEIDDLFGRTGGGNRWHPWRPWTEEWRDRPPQFLKNYYALNPGIGESVVGVWTGRMRAGFKGEQSPGYSEIGPDALEIGVKAPGTSDDEWKYKVFVSGRQLRGGDTSYYRLFQMLFQGFGVGIDEEGNTFGRRLIKRDPAWNVYPQQARPIYENLNLESDSPQFNPIARGFRSWFASEFGLHESA